MKFPNQHNYRCRKVAEMPFVDDGFDQCEPIESHSTYDTLEPSLDEIIFLREVIKTVSKKLNKRQKLVIIRRFYYNDTLEEAGKILAVSKERVRQLELRALDKMRQDLKIKWP